MNVIRIGIIGAHGQLGKTLMHNMDKYQDQMTLVPFGRDQINFSMEDFSSNLVHVLKDYAIDVVINAAAYTDVNKAETVPQEALVANWQGPKGLAIACQKLSIPLIHISTDYVFDGHKIGLYNEGDEPRPISFYGLSKLAGELAVSEYASRFIIIRTAWLFSPFGKNFVKTMLGLAEQQDTLKIVADQTGTPTYAVDLAHALLAISRQITDPGFKEWGIYHYSGDDALTWHDYTKMIFQLGGPIGVKTPKDILPISSEDFFQAAKRPRNSALSNQKIKRVFGVHPSRLEHGIQETIKYLHTQGEYSHA